MSKKFIYTIAFIWILAGCRTTSVTYNSPIPNDFPITTQQHVQATDHWSKIAQDLASQVDLTLDKHRIKHVPIFIKHPPVKSEFTVAFHDFLIDSLVKKGIKVNRVNGNNTVFEYKVQSIEFNSQRNFPSISKFANETKLSNGLVVKRDVSESNLISQQDNANESSINSFGNLAPNLELLISSAIVDKNIYLMKTTDIYYGNKDDKALYQGGNNNIGNRNNVFDDAFYHQ